MEIMKFHYSKVITEIIESKKLQNFRNKQNPEFKNFGIYQIPYIWKFWDSVSWDFQMSIFPDIFHFQTFWSSEFPEILYFWKFSNYILPEISEFLDYQILYF